MSAVAPAAGRAVTPEAPGHRFSLLKPLTWLVVMLVVAITVIPLIFVIEGGFRSTAQINASPVGLPHPWVWHNYTAVLFSPAFWRFLGNSALIAVVATVATVGFGSMASFALSRIEFKGREALFTLFTVGLLFPIGVASLPLYLLLQRIHMLDNPFGVAIPQAAFSLSIAIVILRPFMRAIPAEIEDAAVADGATRLTFFVRILLPLCRPALVTVAILVFVYSWNNYLLAYIVFTSPQHFTLPLGVATFQTQYSQDTARIFAFTALSMVPALGFFVLAECRIVAGLSGSLKG